MKLIDKTFDCPIFNRSINIENQTFFLQNSGWNSHEVQGLRIHVERAPGLRTDMPEQPGHGTARWRARQTAQDVQREAPGWHSR